MALRKQLGKIKFLTGVTSWNQLGNLTQQLVKVAK